MKLNIVLLVVGVLPMLLVATHILSFGFQDNVNAALVNGFLYGLIVAGILNIIAIKISKK